MKKGLVLPVVFIILATISFPNANLFSEQAEASIGENYIPFHVGNQWTYTDGTKELTFSIIGTQEINGHTYYKFDDYFSAGLAGAGQTMGTEVLLRYDTELDAVLMYLHFRGEDVDVTRYDFGGCGWAMAGLWSRFKQRCVTCDVPAGQFSHCVNFQFLGYDCGPDCYGYGEYLAPGVGCVKYVVPGGWCFGTDRKEGDRVTFQLQSYEILPSCGDADHPYPVGDLNHDCRVDMLDLAILSSNWLQDNTPVNSNSVVKDAIEYYVQTDKSVYHLGEDVELLYRVTNWIDDYLEPFVQFIFTYGPIDNTCDWMVDKDELRVWDNLRRPSTAAGCSFLLSYSKSFEYTQTWNMTDKNGNNILPGNYNVTGVLGYWKTDDRYVPVSVQIEIIPDTPLNSNSVVKDGIEYYMETDKAVYDLGEQVEVLYRVTNRTEIPTEIVGILNCCYAAHLVITDADNMEIWEYHRVYPPCGWTTLHLEAHESKEYQKVWNMMNDNGTWQKDDDFPIGPGSYHITGELQLSGGCQRVPLPVDIEITRYPADN